ncbi:MAG: hypothetical protein ACJASQ_003183 [Crocinitomicaceae bacterium]|jgi:hypothetical protein
MTNDLFIWLGIVFCVTQSAIFSGLNLAFFSLTRLRLEIEIETETSSAPKAEKVLEIRKDSNFLLTTILWGNVSINVLLTLLSDSVMTGVVSFTFSTVVITFLGEIIPQAYFSRNALRMASLLAPVLKFYQILLFPVAKPCALLLDYWLGKESVQYFEESNIKLFIKKHIEGSDNEIDRTEGLGAINFFSLDDVLVMHEGEIIDPKSIVSLESKDGIIVFPEFNVTAEDSFVQKINSSGKKWMIFTDENNDPKLVMDIDRYMRSELFTKKHKPIEDYCHPPIVLRSDAANLGILIKKLKTNIDPHSDSPISNDIVLFWQKDQKRIITGADILGQLLKGI